jgi:hypothetical protein
VLETAVTLDGIENDVRDVQLVKPLSLIFNIPLGSVIIFKLVQPLNIFPEIYFNPVPKVTLVREVQFRNALPKTSVNEFGKVIDVRELQPENASSPINVVLVIEIYVKELQLLNDELLI